MRFYNEACNVLVNKMTATELSLDVIRKKVFFHNSIDVWISACEEKNMEWFDTEQYKKLRDDGLSHGKSMRILHGWERKKA